MYKFHDTEMPQPAQNSVMLESWIHLLLLMSFNCFQSLSWCIISSCCVSSCYITACYTTTCATRESLHPLWSQYPAWEDVLAALLKWTDHVHAMWAWHRLKTWGRHVPPPSSSYSYDTNTTWPSWVPAHSSLFSPDLEATFILWLPTNLQKGT